MRSHDNSAAVWAKHLYSDSVEDLATVACFLAHQAMEILPIKKTIATNRPTITSITCPISVWIGSKSERSSSELNTKCNSPFEIRQDTFYCSKVIICRRLHVLTNRVNSKGQIRSCNSYAPTMLLYRDGLWNGVEETAAEDFKVNWRRAGLTIQHSSSLEEIQRIFLLC